MGSPLHRTLSIFIVYALSRIEENVYLKYLQGRTLLNIQLAGMLVISESNGFVLNSINVVIIIRDPTPSLMLELYWQMSL